MKFNVTKTSDWNFVGQIEVNTLEELMSFVDKNGPCILTSPFDTKSSVEKWRIPSIEIYDDYRED